MIAIASLILGSLLLAGLVAILIMSWLKGPEARSHDPFDPKSRAIAKAGRMKRMLNPTWDDFEARFGAPPPHVLRRLYEDHELVTDDDIEAHDPDRNVEPWEVSQFHCVDAREMNGEWDCLDEDLFTFASDGFGNPFLVRITDDVNDPLPVWFWMHDGGTDQLEAVCPSLMSFVDGCTPADRITW